MKVHPSDIDEVHRILQCHKPQSDEFVYAFTRLLIRLYDRGSRSVANDHTNVTTTSDVQHMDT